MVNFMFDCMCQPKINEYDDDDEWYDTIEEINVDSKAEYTA